VTKIRRATLYASTMKDATENSATISASVGEIFFNTSIKKLPEFNFRSKFNLFYKDSLQKGKATKF
jgi:hypothetical protein